MEEKIDIIARLLNTDEGKQKLKAAIIRSSDEIAVRYSGTSLGYTAEAFSYMLKGVIPDYWHELSAIEKDDVIKKLKEIKDELRWT